MSELVMCFFMAVSSMTPVLPAPPAKFLPSLSSAGTAKKKKHSASSALNQNNYPKKCTAEPVRGEGNEAQRLLAITSLQSLLVISLLLWKRTRMAWEEAMCSQQTDRQTVKRSDANAEPKKYQPPLKALAAWQLIWGTGSHPHTIISLMFCLSGFLLSPFFKTLNLSF